MSALLANASALTSIGIILLAAALVIMAIWVAVLSVKVSRLKALLLLESEQMRTMSMRTPPAGNRRQAPVQAAAQPTKAAPVKGLREEQDDERGRKPKSRKGKPTIPFGVNKEAQERAARAYTESADEPDYSPDSIDFNKVKGLTGQRLQTLQSEARPARTVQPVMTHAVETNPRTRIDVRQIEQQTTGRMPTVGARKAASETRASFDRVSEDMRRMSDRQERAVRRQRLSERRHQEQMRREAESIVAAHHREMRSINEQRMS